MGAADWVELRFHFGPGDAEWETYAIDNARALVLGDQVRLAGLARSKDSPLAAFRKAGLV